MEESIYKLTSLLNSRGDSDRHASRQLREAQQAGNQTGGRDDDPNLAQGMVNLFLVQKSIPCLKYHPPDYIQERNPQ